MNKLEQAAQQILEALEGIGFVSDYWNEKVTALREALAEQAEQEPVGYFAYDEEHDIWEELTGPNAPGATPLYTAPARTKDLTDDEIVHLVNSVWFLDELVVAKVNFARAAIAADREKNK